MPIKILVENQAIIITISFIIEQNNQCCSRCPVHLNLNLNFPEPALSEQVLIQNTFIIYNAFLI
jgi:hypothetical protein